MPTAIAFSSLVIATGEATIHSLKGGQGLALLLLHGFPEAHLMWHAVADQLAADFTVVAADLRGQGAGSKPASTPTHEPYSERVRVNGGPFRLLLLGMGSRR